MATNKYFNNGNSEDTAQEHDLVDDLTIELIQIHGQNMYYCPRNLVKEDKLLGEDVLSSFDKNFLLEMYIDSVDQFGGEGDILGKFGIEINDEVDLIVSRKKFKLETGSDRPFEGDLIYFPLSNSLFEIKFVEHENPFYQLGKLFAFKLTCQLFEPSHEDLDVGIAAVDDLDDALLNDDNVDNEPFADNVNLETEGNAVIDFSEINPFGEVR